MFSTSWLASMDDCANAFAAAGTAVRRRDARGEAGFSLLELLVALSIVALALVIAVPNIRQASGSNSLRLLSHRVASELQLARSKAILERRPVAFVADARTGAFGVEVGSIVLPPETVLAIAGSLLRPAGPHASRIVFFPDGSSSGGRVTLGNLKSLSMINVDWLTGSVAFEERAP